MYKPYRVRFTLHTALCPVSGSGPDPTGYLISYELTFSRLFRSYFAEIPRPVQTLRSGFAPCWRVMPK